ncbi:MAG: reductive dehalogenase domain-containing protein [Candidatus Izemoplasma sp.]
MKKYDERNTFFSRLNLKEDSVLYNEYYRDKHEQKIKDDPYRNSSFRDALKKDDNFKKLFSPLSSNNKVLIKSLFDTVENFEICEKQNVKPSFAKNIKEITKYFGAQDVGIVKLNEFSYYSHSGGLSDALLKDNYGEKIKPKYSHAIIFTILMKKELMNRAPFFEELLATELAYYQIADVGARVAIYLKSIGYDAFLNNSEYYLAPLVPLAYDAGLGEIGISNHLITKEYGDNVRIGAVFTNLELDLDHPIDFGLKDFCKACALCLINCPSNAITHKPRVVNGRQFYKFDDVSCYEMWDHTGTDCGICIQSCPFTQGVDLELVDQMIGNDEIMKKIVDDHLEKYGRRNLTKEENIMLKRDE